MNRRAAAAPGGAREQARRRHGWLDLLQTSGPFLTLPVVQRAFPDGLPVVPAERRAALRALVAAMLDDRGASRHVVVEAMLRDVLDWGEHLLLDRAVPAVLTEVSPTARSCGPTSPSTTPTGAPLRGLPGQAPTRTTRTARATCPTGRTGCSAWSPRGARTP